MVIDRGTVAQTLPPGSFPAVDPRRRRFGYSPGLWQMECEPRTSGRNERLIPQGILLRFDSATLADENYEINTPVYTPRIKKEYSAEWFIAQVKVNFAPYGFTELDALTLLDDPRMGETSLPHLYFDAVHPEFASIGHECPEGLTVCVTCRLKLLDGPVIAERIRGVIGEGLDADILQRCHSVVRLSNQVYYDFATVRWGEITGELADRRAGAPRGITSLKGGEHHVRRHLHEIAPEERGALAAANFGAAQAEVYAEAQREQTAVLREAITATRGDSEEVALLKEQNRLLWEKVEKGEQKATKEKGK